MREQPRQIYTSVRTDDRASSPSSVRAVVVTVLAVLALALVVVAVLSLV